MFTISLFCLLLTSVPENDDKGQTIQTQFIAKWEYKLVASDAETSPEKLQGQMDLLGDQGWELTAVIPRRSVSAADTLLFKRRKESNDVDISFQPEIGLVTIRGEKSAVERTVNVIEEIKKKKSPIK
jgi:hypothetical protein